MTSDAGHDAVTTRGVAAAAGVEAGMLRHDFPPQNTLHAAAVHHVMDDTIDDVDIADATRDPGDRLARCVLRFLPSHMSERQLLDMWLSMCRHALEPGTDSMAASELDVSVRRSHARMTGWLEQLAGADATAPDRIDGSVLMLNALTSRTCSEIVTPGAVRERMEGAAIRGMRVRGGWRGTGRARGGCRAGTRRDRRRGIR